MKEFSPLEIEKLARGYDSSPGAISRLLNSTAVELDGKTYNLGFQINSAEFYPEKSVDETLGEVTHLFLEFKRLCPRVSLWLRRGDFNPARVPKTITKAELVHACRTLSRLRAESLRDS